MVAKNCTLVGRCDEVLGAFIPKQKIGHRKLKNEP